MRREVQKRDVEERSRYCPRTGAYIEEQKIGIEEEIRMERQETRTNQKYSVLCASFKLFFLRIADFSIRGMGDNYLQLEL